MTKGKYRILLIDGSVIDTEKVKRILSERYLVVVPKTVEEASRLLSQESFEIALLNPRSLEMLKDSLAYNKKCLNPNILKIVIAELSSGNEMKQLEGTGEIYHFLLLPFTSKELLLTMQMALKSYEIALERSRLINKLNDKARILLNQRKKLTDAFAKLKEANLDAIRVLSEAIEAKDPYTRGHCKRVSKMAKAIAQHLNYDEKMMNRLELGAFLHDIGKIGIRGAILNKNGKLSQEEMAHVREHTTIGENIVKTVEWCRRFLHIVRSHHEMYDGTGYPDGLKGESIPLDARILGIADAFDAMTSERPYRGALPLEEVLKRLMEGRGTQFDPVLLDIFISNEIYKKDLSNVTGFSFSFGQKSDSRKN